MNADDVFDRDLERFLERAPGDRTPGYLTEMLASDRPDPQRAVVVEPRKVASRGPDHAPTARPVDPPARDRAARPARPAAWRRSPRMARDSDTVCRPRSGSLGTVRSWSAPTATSLVVDPATGERRPLISGPAFDFGPVFSRDGTRFLFLRGGPTDCGQPDCGLLLMVANADGTASVR